MLGPLLFVYMGIIVKQISLQLFFCNSKKNSKKAFFTKNFFFTEHEFEKCCEAKKVHKGHITERRKNFNQKKIKIEGVAFI